MQTTTVGWIITIITIQYLFFSFLSFFISFFLFFLINVRILMSVRRVRIKIHPSWCKKTMFNNTVMKHQKSPLLRIRNWRKCRQNNSNEKNSKYIHTNILYVGGKNGGKKKTKISSKTHPSYRDKDHCL